MPQSWRCQGERQKTQALIVAATLLRKSYAFAFAFKTKQK
jgi:hypothetical protein